MKTLTAFCDLQFCPVSFDFVTWLVRAMKERDDRHLEELHVVIVPVDGGLGGFSRNWGKHDASATRWRLWHIVIAACPMARATVTLASNRKQAQAMMAAEHIWWPEGKAHFMGPLIDAARTGQKIPKLRATPAAIRYVRDWTTHTMPARFVTMTLRQQDTDPDRNSDLAAWAQLSEWLEGRDHPVITIGDSHYELREGRGFAALDPDLRLALYEQAAMNLIGNNGPQELLKFSEAPYLVFGVGLGGWAEHFRKYFHMEPGEQLPWARADQRMVYAPDTFGVMRKEFEQWETSFGLGG